MTQSPPPEWVCPRHYQKLQRSGESLLCPNCPRGVGFPVVGGIPRFVESSSYAEPFGLQWKRYRLTQLDSWTGVPISRQRLERCLGLQLWDSLKSKQVLECGCGAGRFTEVLLAEGAIVTSVDITDAVDANRDNCAISQSHRIAQADILLLPFSPQQFDIVLCLGVVQHTPNPEQTIAHLFAQVKPGGSLIIDHYTHNLSWYTKTAPLFRHVLKRVPAATGIKMTEWLVRVFLPFHKAVRHLRVGQMLLSRISPVLCYYRSYPQLGDTLQRDWAILDTHDSLTDWFKHFRTRREITQVLTRLGLEQIHAVKTGNGIEARAVRPPSADSKFVPLGHGLRSNRSLTREATPLISELWSALVARIRRMYSPPHHESDTRRNF